MIEPGMTIAQKFWVERVLGKGGMGIVVAATHLQLGQRVALKFLHGGGTEDADVTERFMREARSAVRLRSEHVGRVLDVGQTEDGAPYIVMEYLDGCDLASQLAARGALPVVTLVDYMLQACLGLGEAHAASIVHRDLKPSNIFLTRRPEGTPLIKVLDFGIAKARGRMDARLTDSAAMMGSPGYMSPEQLKNARDVDVRADVWALGVCLYELATAVKPFGADSFAEMAAKVAMDPPPPLPASLPRGFAAAVMRCLEKDPDRRFDDVGALARALAPFGSPGADAIAASVARLVANLPGPRRTDPVAAVMAAATMTRMAPGRVTAPAIRMRRRFWLGVSAGAGVAVLAAAVLVAVVSGGRASAPVGAGDAREHTDAPAAAAPAPALPPAEPAPPAPVVLPDAGAADEAVGPSPSRPGSAPGTRSRGSRPGSGKGSSAATGSGSGSGAGTGSGTTTVPAVVPHDPDDLDGDGIPDKR